MKISKAPLSLLFHKREAAGFDTGIGRNDYRTRPENSGKIRQRNRRFYNGGLGG